MPSEYTLIPPPYAPSALEPIIEAATVSLHHDVHHAGYVKGATGMLTAEERALLPESGAVLTLEVAVRFLADYLAGDVYFRVKHPEHNLVRARAQLVMARKLVAAMPELHAIAAEQERKLGRTA